MTTFSVSEFLARARGAAGKGIKYKLGRGGMSPAAALPASHDNLCDCSGYVSWCMGMSRQTTHPLYVAFNSGWINTDAMVHDANAATGFIERIEGAKVGCLIVYGKNPKASVGHVGIVTAVKMSGGKTTATKVIHCSSGNSAKGDAIAETGPEVFERIPQTIYAWYAGVT
jgi:hypothetical protein